MALDPSQGYPYTAPDCVMVMGGIQDQADALIQAVDTTMRTAYDAHIARVGQNIYPMIYVDFTVVGGRYTLVESADKIHVRQPDLRAYAQLKAVAHTPLGIFLMIGEYAAYPGNGQWIPPLEAYRDQLVKSQYQIAHVNTALLPFPKNACIDILDKSLAFINGILSRRTFTLEEFRTYNASIIDAVQLCMQHSGRDQVNGMSAVVQEFKSILGSRWDDVYVVISAIWTLTRENIHELIFQKEMSAEHQETHIIVSEAVPTLDAARTLLGRIVGDRVIGEYVFGRNGAAEQKENLYSISSSRDLLSRVAHSALGSSPEQAMATAEADFARHCPHLAPKGSSASGLHSPEA